MRRKHKISRGTTPTLVFTTDNDLRGWDVWVTVASGEVKITKHGDKVACGYDDVAGCGWIRFSLTEAETLCLPPTSWGEVGYRASRGKAETASERPARIVIYDTIYEGVIVDG